MKRFIPFVLWCCLILLPGLAQAQGQGWTAFSADTLGRGRSAFVGQAGYPGVSLGLLTGASDKMDIGGRFTFNYGQEGIVSIINPGLKLQGWLRVLLAQGSRANVGLTFQPGMLLYFSGGTTVGMALPVELVVGFPVSSALALHAGMDVPLQVYFGSGSTAVIPILFGGGAEYFLDQSLSLNFTLKMGPSIVTNGGSVYFTLQSLFGLAYAF